MTDPIPRLQQIAATIEESGADIFDAPATAVQYKNIVACARRRYGKINKVIRYTNKEMLSEDLYEQGNCNQVGQGSSLR